MKIDIDDLPRYISGLRREASTYRRKLRETEEALQAAQQRIAELMLDNADLQAGIAPHCDGYCESRRSDEAEIAKGLCPRSGNPFGTKGCPERCGGADSNCGRAAARIAASV